MNDVPPNPESETSRAPPAERPDRDRKTTPREWGLFALMIGGGAVALCIVGGIFIANLAEQLEEVEARSVTWDEPPPEIEPLPEANPLPPPVLIPEPSMVNGRCDIPALSPDQLAALASGVLAGSAADPTTPALVENPNWARRPTAQFPYEAAKRQGVERGRVVLDCLTDSLGGVMACAVQSEDPPGAGFASAALEGMCSARFNPQTIDGVPQASMVRYAMRFQLRG